MKTLLVISLLTGFSTGVLAQDIEELLSKYTQGNGMNYLQPLADAAGADFNTGLFHGGAIRKMGFQLYIGITMPVALIPEKHKYFTGLPEGFFEPKNPEEVPTIFGPSETVIVDGDGGTQYAFPAGINMDYLPMPMAHLTVGSVFGTDATFRFLSTSTNEELGRLNLFSFGLRHSITQYLPGFPVDIAAGIYNQYFKLGTIVDARTWLFNLQGSYDVSIFTFYGALGYERSNLGIEYSFTGNGDETVVNFDLRGSNSVRLTAGVTFNFGPVKLNADYNLANQSVVSVGLGIGFGEKNDDNNK